MGSGTDFILGGLLSGVGRGVEQTAVANRQAALEKLRIEADRQKDDRDYQRQTARDTRQQDFAIEREEIAQTGRERLLEKGGTIQERRDAAQAAQTARLEALRSSLRRAETAQELKLKDALDRDDVQDVVVNSDNEYVIITKDGKSRSTGVIGRPPAATANASEGGRLTDSEQEAAYSEARRAWAAGGRQGEEPRRSKFIGMTREDYQASIGGAAPATDAGARARAVAELGTIYANATPERYPGLFRNGRKIPLSEAKRMIEDRYAR